MLAEIAEGEVVACGRASCLRNDDLASVGGCGDARNAVDIDPRVVVVVEGRPAGVDAHPHPKWQRCKSALRIARGNHRVGRLPESNEERVAFAAENDAAVRLDSFANQPPVLD
jgi:hypothetical protein